MEPWQQLITEGVLASIVPSTARAYERVIKNFLSFASEGGLRDPWPIQEAVLLWYLAHLRELGLAPKTICIHTAALTFYSCARGFPGPCQSFLARKAIEDWRQLSPRPSDSRRPVPLSMLQAAEWVLPAVCHSAFEAVLFKAAFFLAFFGALRCSELVIGSRADVEGRALAVTDVTIRDSVLQVVLRWSKTDQSAHGAHIILHAGPRGTPCPVRNMRKYLAVRPPVSELLLVHADGSCLSRYQFVSVFRACLSAAGFAARGHSGHSFRIGAVTAVAIMGFSADRNKAIGGRWKSGAYRLYVRPEGSRGISHH